MLRALRHDLRSQYAPRFHILTASSAEAVKDLIDHAAVRSDIVALIIAGFDVAERLYPSLGEGPARVVLTSFDDESRVIDEMDDLRAGCVAPVPWTPPETHLYPVVDDALADWQATHPIRDTAVRIVGHRWAQHTHAAKDFLGRNQVPFRWLDLDRSKEASDLLVATGAADRRLPIVFLPDGRILDDPSTSELATALGMHTHADAAYYDLAIVGAGPAGLAAAVYGASEGLSTVLIEREAPGGQAGTSSRIENYLGFPEGVSGADLARRALEQAKRLGAEVLSPQSAERLEITDSYKEITLGDQSAITCRSVIVATGLAYRHLSTPGMDELTGAGIYYGAATTEARDAAGEHVYIVGAANSAGQGAMYFSKFADRVTMLVRGKDLTVHMSAYLIDQIESTPNIEVMTQSRIAEAVGEDGHLAAIAIEDLATGAKTTVPARFLFVFIGAEPDNTWVDGLLSTDPRGYLLTGEDLIVDGEYVGWPLDRHPYHLETNIPGIFAAGDVRHGSIRRVAGGVGEGATCVQLVHRYLASVH